ncbi:hypothetical protein EYC84_005909 [Monilinia fructicola]|uniref:C2H2-type domain-containing protein n=1 Tax=Monilinia fructicola TaxID=38448 RepID=A0A5M9JY13_MONFR|nr:hypothetical protein EYC84_005909 [Monilinia fructicola]
MLPLTDDQESTLKRWASYNLGRPQDGFMAFLMGETGLQEEQINHWWTNQVTARLDSKSTSGKIGPTTKVDACNIEINGFDLGINLPDLAFDLFGDNMEDFDSAFSDLDSWSQIENSCYNLPYLSSISTNYHTQKHCGLESSENLLHSDTMSSSDTASTSSTPSIYGIKRASNRSSGFSCGSGGTWGTTSTLFSVDEEHAAEPTDSFQALPQYKAMDSTRPTSIYNSKNKLPADPNKNQLYTRHHNLESNPQPSTSSRRRSSTNLNAKKLPDIPVRYSCTNCGKTFERKSAKGDWKRHEQTKCEQQKLWYCMPKEPTIQALNTWHCMLCNYVESNRNNMFHHIVNQHSFQRCWRKSLSEKCHPRKDKLRDHLKRHHGLSEGSKGWEGWYQDLPEKKAWGCGFCGGCFFTWDARIDHIAEHYEKQGLDVSHWSLTNVIKGLLKQSREWDMVTAWKNLVGNNDLFYTWLDDDAAILQRKLEYREGTPQELADEARSLAKKSPHKIVPGTRPLSESHAVRLARDMLTETSRETSVYKGGEKSCGQPFMLGVGHVDTGLWECDFNGFI